MLAGERIGVADTASVTVPVIVPVWAAAGAAIIAAARQMNEALSFIVGIPGDVSREFGWLVWILAVSRRKQL